MPATPAPAAPDTTWQRLCQKSTACRPIDLLLEACDARTGAFPNSSRKGLLKKICATLARDLVDQLMYTLMRMLMKLQTVLVLREYKFNTKHRPVCHTHLLCFQVLQRRGEVSTLLCDLRFRLRGTHPLLRWCTDMSCF